MRMRKQTAFFSASTIVILVYLVFHTNFFGARDHWTVESNGAQTTVVFAKSGSCKIGLHESGIHVIGLGRSRGESAHVGFIEDFNRIEKLKEIESKLKDMALKYRHVGITTNGGTHKKPALTRIRDDVALEILSEGEGVEAELSFSPVQFFKKYNMGKFLSVEHGASNPYLMIRDTWFQKKVVEKSGRINDKIKFTLKF
jgi:hypothetical protein